MRSILTCLASLLLVLGLPAFGQSSLWLQRVDDVTGAGQAQLFEAPATPFDAYTFGSGRAVEISTSDANVQFSAPAGQLLQPGVYENLGWWFSDSVWSALVIDDGSVYGSCTPLGRIVILDVGFDASMNVTRFAADLELRCDSASATLWSEVRYNSTLPLTIDKPAGSQQPDPMAFGDRLYVPPSTLVTSDPTTVYGINAPAPISIAGGAYSVNGGPYTTDPGTVSNRDHVRVQVTTPATAGDSTVATLCVGGIVATFTAATDLPGSSHTGIFLDGHGQPLLGTDSTAFLDAPAWVIAARIYTQVDGPQLQITATGNDLYGVGLTLRGIQETPVTAGVYEEAVGIFGFADPSAVVNYHGNSCSLASHGRFNVLEIDSFTAPTRLAVNAEVWCDSDPLPTTVEVRINSSVPFSFESNAVDTTPDPMAFYPVTRARPGSIQVSSVSYVSGVNAPVPISITGGEYSVNGGAYTAAPGFVNNFDALHVRLKASVVPGETLQAVLTAGGQTSVFGVQTTAAFLTQTGISVQGQAGEPISHGNFLFLPGSRSVFTVQHVGSLVQVNVDGTDGHFFTANFAAPTGSQLAPGIYENATSAIGSASPRLDVDGDYVGCNTTGRFVVRDVTFAGNGDVTSFAADFMQNCTGFPGNLYGQVRYNSTVPFGVLLEPNGRADLDGDGNDDLLWQNADGRVAAWMMNGSAMSGGSEILPGGTGWTIAHRGDFDADGNSDIVWQHPDGRMAIWTMNGAAPTSTQQLLDAGSGWQVTHVADLDGDGKSDLVFANTDGSVAAWLMSGTTPVAGATLLGPGTGWSVSQVADFDGDGRADLLWIHVDGRAAIWLMSGTTVKATNQILNAAGGWSPAVVADLDGDGKADIVWRNADGRMAVWLMNGAAMAGGGDILGAGSGWSVIRAADFDGDGKADLLFQHTDGRVAIWLMDGATPKQTGQILNAGTGWTPAAVADLDGDGRADIVWQHTDGRYAAWLMFGTVMASGGGILGTGSGWNVVP